DDVAAEELAVLLVADDLDQPGAVAVDGPGADRAVLHLADGDVVTLLARLSLGETEAGDVRRAERGTRDVDVLDRMGLETGRVLACDHALVRGLVRERWAVDEVADRVHARGGRAHRTVHFDQATVLELDSRGLESERLDVGSAPGRDHQPIDTAGILT